MEYDDGEKEEEKNGKEELVKVICCH